LPPGLTIQQIARHTGLPASAVYQHIYMLRKAGMTVTEVGELLGSKGVASELLRCKRKEPSQSQTARLCRRFKVDVGLFL
jgi:DNA-binding transcriptional ArsR family regulator